MKVFKETQGVVEGNFEAKKFYTELTTLLDLLAGYEKWLGSAEKAADEAQEINRQLEQCKVSGVQILSFLNPFDL